MSDKGSVGGSGNIKTVHEEKRELIQIQKAGVSVFFYRVQRVWQLIKSVCQPMLLPFASNTDERKVRS
jgi:hypothetical protein